MLRERKPEERRKLLRSLATVAPRDDDWLHWWVKTYLGFHIPRVQVCEHHQSPFEAFAHSYFARDPIVVWEGSRGFSGKSITLSALTLTEIITLGTNVRLLGGSGEQAQRINAYIRNQDPNSHGMFWEATLSPTELLSGTTKTEVRLKNGGYVKALMASPQSIRGAHPVRLRIDEVDEMELDLYDASMGQTMSRNGVAANTTISSTHHHPDGTMTEVKRRAMEHEHPVFRWCYKETMQPHGWLDPAEIERKRQEVPSSMFEVEYDLHEPLAEGRIFTEEVLKSLFDPALGEFDGRPREEVIVVPPDSESTFYHGADWGRRKDWTVLHSMKTSSTGPDMLAAWSRMQRLDWPIMIAAWNNRIEAYGGASMHDETGLGDVVAAYMTADSEGFDFNHKKERSEMFWAYVAACEAGELVYPKIAPLYQAHRFVTVDDLFLPGGHPPDEIAAAALAWRAREYAHFRVMLSRL